MPCLLAANPKYVEGEVLVTFKDSVPLEKAGKALSAHQLGLNKHFRSISKITGRQIGLVRSKTRSTAQLIATLQQDPAILIAEPSFVRRAYGTVPNDAFFS